MSQLSDPIADFLTRLRNASAARKETLEIPFSKLKAEMTRILKQEGYITEYEVDTSGKFPLIRVQVKYVQRAPAITGLKRVSKPGCRRYVSCGEIPRVLGGMGISILSTSHGVLSGREAKKQKVGGELLAYVW